MEITTLSSEERVLSGFTQRFNLTHADLTESTANTAQTIAILSVLEGFFVYRAAMRLKTAFKDASDAAFNTNTLIVGDDGNDDRYIASAELNENGSEVLAKEQASTCAYTYLADNTIDAIVGSMSAKSLSNIDTGEVDIFLGVVDLDAIGS